MKITKDTILAALYGKSMARWEVYQALGGDPLDDPMHPKYNPKPGSDEFMINKLFGAPVPVADKHVLKVGAVLHSLSNAGQLIWDGKETFMHPAAVHDVKDLRVMCKQAIIAEACHHHVPPGTVVRFIESKPEGDLLELIGKYVGLRFKAEPGTHRPYVYDQPAEQGP